MKKLLSKDTGIFIRTTTTLKSKITAYAKNEGVTVTALLEDFIKSKVENIKMN